MHPNCGEKGSLSEVKESGVLILTFIKLFEHKNHQSLPFRSLCNSEIKQIQKGFFRDVTWWSK